MRLVFRDDLGQAEGERFELRLRIKRPLLESNSLLDYKTPRVVCCCFAKRLLNWCLLTLAKPSLQNFDSPKSPRKLLAKDRMLT